MNNETKRIKELLPLAKILEAYGAQKVSANCYWCPKHEHGGKAAGHQTPSLVVHPKSQTATCKSQGCFEGDDQFGIISKMEGLDIKAEFSKVLEAAAEMAGVALEQPPKFKEVTTKASPNLLRGVTPLTVAHQEYLLNRKLDEDIIAKADFRSLFDKIVFLHKSGSEIVGYKAKTTLSKTEWDEQLKKSPKWKSMFQKGVKPDYWSVDTLHKKEIIYLVAGEYDLCIFFQGLKVAGLESKFGVVTMVNGEASSIKDSTIKYFTALDNTEWRIIYDYDDTGLAQMPKRAQELLATGRKVYTFTWKPEFNPKLKSGYDINDYFKDHGTLDIFFDLANFELAKPGVKVDSIEVAGDEAGKRFVYRIDNRIWEFDSTHLRIRDLTAGELYKKRYTVPMLQKPKFKSQITGELADLKLCDRKEAKRILTTLALKVLDDKKEKEAEAQKVELLDAVTLDEVWEAVSKIGVTTRPLVEILMAACVSVAFKFPVPIWFILIGNPSSLKTELIRLPRGLPDRIVYLSTMSENAFASGYMPQDGSEPNDLLDVLDNKILLIRDLTTLFSLNEETVKKILGDLTSIFDGEFEKFTATRGLMRYKAAFPFVACITPAILSKHHNYVNQLGSRFLFYRIQRLTDNQRKQGFAIAWSKEDRKKNIELATSVVSSYCTQTVKKVESGFSPKVEDSEVQEWLNNAADFVARARGIAITKVEEFKNDKGEDITYYSPVEVQVEEPWRAINQLRNLAISLAAVRNKDAVTMEECETLKEVVRSTAPPDRAIVLDALLTQPSGMSAKEVGEAIEKSTKTAQRQLKELEMLKLVHKFKDPNMQSVTAPYLHAIDPEFGKLLTPADRDNNHEQEPLSTTETQEIMEF